MSNSEVSRRVAWIRSTIFLMRKSADPAIRRAAFHAQEEFRHNLVYKILNYPPPSVSFYINDFDKSYQERKSILCVPPSDKPQDARERRFADMLKDSADSQRRSTWIRRIGVETESLLSDGWYPFFVTLTVDQKAYDAREILQAVGPHAPLTKFIRKCQRMAGRACGVFQRHRKPEWEVSPSEVCRHIGVVEHGDSSHHHHAHFLIYMMDVPDDAKLDPLAGVLVDGYDAKVKARYGPVEALWRYGRATCEFWRCQGDPWSRLGFRMPPSMHGARLGTAFQAGSYLAKYLDKEDREWNHRVRTNQGFGLSMERFLIRNLSTPLLITLTEIPSWDQQLRAIANNNLSVTLLKRLAKRELFMRRWVSESRSAIQKEACPSLRPYGAMLESVRSGQDPWRMLLSERHDWLRQSTGLVAGRRSELLWSRLNAIFEEIDDRCRWDGAVAVSTLG